MEYGKKEMNLPTKNLQPQIKTDSKINLWWPYETRKKARNTKLWGWTNIFLV